MSGSLQHTGARGAQPRLTANQLGRVLGPLQSSLARLLSLGRVQWLAEE
jgi:hypothetical protein